MAKQQLGLFSKQQTFVRDLNGENIRVYDDDDVVLPSEVDLQKEKEFPGILEADEQFELINTWDAFLQVCEDLRVAKAISADTETEGLGKLRHRIIGYSFSYRKDLGPLANVAHDQLRNVYIPVRHRTGESCLDPQKVSEALAPIYERTDCLWAFWNPKYDWHMGANDGLIAPHPTLDGMILRRLIYADKLAGLKIVAAEDIDPEAATAEKLLEIYVTVLCRMNRWKKPSDRDPVGRAYYEYITTSIMAAYAARDTFFTWIATAHYLARVAAVPALLDLAITEHILLDPLYEMEREGLYVSRERVDANSLELDGLMKEMEEKIFEMIQRDINLGSGDQVAALFKEMKIPIIKATEATKKLPPSQQIPSLDGDSLMRLNKKGYEIAGHIHKWRKARDLKSKYLNVLPRIAEKDDCIHASFRQVGTESGRLCVAGDTVLETNMGKFRISDLDLTKNQNVSILTHKGRYRPIVNKYYKGQEEMYKVVLDNGSFIKCTAGHRFLTPKGWRRLDELAEGREVCTPSNYSGTFRGKGSPKGIRRRKLCSDNERRNYRCRSGSAIRRKPSRHQHFKEVLQRKVRRFDQVIKAAKLSPFDDGKSARKKGTTSGSNSKGGVRKISKRWLVSFGIGAKVRYNRVVCSPEHTISRVEETYGSAPLQVAGYGSGLLGTPGSFDTRVAGSNKKLLRQTSRVFQVVVSGIYQGKRTALVHQRVGKWSPLSKRTERGSTRPYLLVNKSRRIVSFTRSFGEKHSTRTSVYFVSKLHGRFLSSVCKFACGSRWRLPSQRQENKGTRRKERKDYTGEGVSSFACDRQRSSDLIGGCFRPDRGHYIQRIESIGIEDVWDIAVEEDHSYIAHGFINHNSSGGPNMQNFPSRGRLAHLVKGIFIIPPELQKDWVWVFADLSQIEVRILTHYCQEPSLVEGYAHGLDIHAATAEAMFGDRWDRADAKERKTLRSIGKQLNFSIVYGVGPKGLSDILFKGDGFEPGIDASEDECKDFIERYMTARPMVISWIEKTRRDARRTGVILNAQGRRREFYELLDRDTPMKVIKGIERELTNFVIQGSAADMYKKGLALSYARFKREGLRIKCINTIHDEIQYLVHKEDLERSAQIVKVAFEEDAAPWCSTPIVMDFEYVAGGDMAWSDKKDLTPEIIETLAKAA